MTECLFRGPHAEASGSIDLEEGDIVKNKKIRMKLLEHDMKYYQLDKILGISEPTRCRMLRNELPEAEQDRICQLIEEFVKKGSQEHE